MGWKPTGGAADHGGLTGLTDDDHPLYSLIDGTRAFTGVVEGVTPTADAHLATKGYVDGIVDGGGSAKAVHQSIFTLYAEPRSSEALAQSSTGGSYVWANDALTASTFTFRFDKGSLWEDILYARWYVVWHPNGDTNNGIRLVHADDGPTNITEIAEFTGRSDTSQIVSETDITTDLATLLAGGAKKHIGHQIKTTGTGMKIYLSRVEVVWEGFTLTSEGVRDAGRWEVVVDGSSPPVAVETEDGSDWVYGWVSS